MPVSPGHALAALGLDRSGELLPLVLCCMKYKGAGARRVLEKPKGSAIAHLFFDSCQCWTLQEEGVTSRRAPDGADPCSEGDFFLTCPTADQLIPNVSLSLNNLTTGTAHHSGTCLGRAQCQQLEPHC